MFLDIDLDDFDTSKVVIRVMLELQVMRKFHVKYDVSLIIRYENVS